MAVIITGYSFFPLRGSFCPLGFLAPPKRHKSSRRTKNWVRGSGREITTFYLSARLCVCRVWPWLWFSFFFVGVWPPPPQKLVEAICHMHASHTDLDGSQSTNSSIQPKGSSGCPWQCKWHDKKNGLQHYLHKTATNQHHQLLHFTLNLFNTPRYLTLKLKLK